MLKCCMIRILQIHKWENTLYDSETSSCRKSPVKNNGMQEHWEESPPHQKAPVWFQSDFMPHSPILTDCNMLFSVIILVLQRDELM